MTDDRESDATDARRLRASLARLQRRLRAERGEIGLGPSRYGALACLYRNGPMHAVDLAAHERLQPQSLTRVLAALEDQHLITRRTDEADRRRVRIEITPAGVDRLRTAVGRQETWLAEALRARLTPVERDLMMLAIRLMDRLADTD
ncbi:MAG TPA: MarR family transcriptional regulator [Aliidongia sp.]|uniref:MarR family winged helix-turn-helix transcriptional regulator n=1 Tax=Aliidongia sp. TaxID=1914230 RepID=UPI002DDDA756|nr:MarR family transcriptional regulator [Aliidongia sp.]HEV2673827.1 MarR family transcriptional regulator [Aliidongia sp.]